MFILAYSPVALQGLFGKLTIDKIRSKTVLLQQATVFKASCFIVAHAARWHDKIKL